MPLKDETTSQIRMKTFAITITFFLITTPRARIAHLLNWSHYLFLVTSEVIHILFKFFESTQIKFQLKQYKYNTIKC